MIGNETTISERPIISFQKGQMLNIIYETNQRTDLCTKQINEKQIWYTYDLC